MTLHSGLHIPPGSPDMQFGSLAIWVLARQFSESEGSLPAFIESGARCIL